MHPRTVETLNQLRSIEWFANVGQKNAKSAEVLTNWDDAIKSCSSPDWEDLCLEAVNQYCDKLVKRDPAAFERWNDIVDLVKPTTEFLVKQKTATVIAAHGLPKVFVDTVAWDILHLAMEAEYAEIHPPGFYAAQAFWYLKGHFPCGWQGSFPNGGRLIIF